jgi:hypothetical protein
LQVGYLHAVPAAAKCSLANPNPDRRLDWVVTHQSTKHTAGDDEPTLKIALKATGAISIQAPQNGSFPFSLKNEHLQYLNLVAPTVNRMLVVMILPKDIEKWVFARADYLELRHCCYWVNLAGVATRGKEKTTVRVPTGQVFDDLALCDIMERIGAGGVP